MRSVLFLAALALPVAAKAEPAEPQPKAKREAPQLPPELSDPAMGAKLGAMMGAMGKAVMDMPVGEIEAAVAGRAATSADKKRRVRDAVGGPAEARKLEQQIAASGPMVQQMTGALVKALPAIMESLDGVEEAVERAASNLPDPTYPRR